MGKLTTSTILALVLMLGSSNGELAAQAQPDG